MFDFLFYSADDTAMDEPAMQGGAQGEIDTLITAQYSSRQNNVTELPD